MARIALNKVHKIKTRQRSNSALNKAGGHGFKLNDAAELLLSTVASYMGEPGFYPDKIQFTPSKKYNSQVLDERGTDIFDAAIELCLDGAGEDVLRIANWARNEMNMRLVPQILLVAAAKFLRSKDGSENPVRRYVNLICRRPDDCLQVLALMSALFGSRKANYCYPRVTLPNALKEGLAMTLSNFSVYQILKYNNTRHRPNMMDLLGMLKGLDKSVAKKYVKNRGGFPLEKGLHDYLVQGKVTVDSPAEIKARSDFFKLPADTKLGEEVEVLMKVAGLTWENLVSHFGASATTASRKRQLWTKAAMLMPYMACLRNLRNFVEADVDCKVVAAKISHPAKIARSKQLPFRFYSAYQALSQAQGDASALKTAVSAALDLSVANLTELPGRTAVFADNSGSMGVAISAKSKLRAMEVANLLCAIVAKQSKDSLVAAFATSVDFVKLNRNKTVLQMAKSVRASGAKVGHGTNFSACIAALRKNKSKVDRIIVLTDMQSYGEHYSGTGTVQDELQKYRREVNKDVYFHAVNLVGHSVVMAQPAQRVQCMSGFSEKFIDNVAKFEQTEKSSILAPGLADIRERFSLEKALDPKPRKHLAQS